MSETSNSLDSHEIRQDFTELPFSQVSKGDKIIVQTHYKILNEDRFPTYEFNIQGVRKDGLRVRVEPTGGAEGFLGRLVGTIAQNGVTEGVIRTSQDGYNKLLIKTVKHLNGEPRSTSMSTAEVVKITLVKKI